MASFLRDLRHAARTLASRPVLTATTVLTLAIGIGGISALVALANGLLLGPLPVRDPGSVVRVFGAEEETPFGITSFSNLRDLADRARTLQSLTIHQQTFAAFGLGDETVNVAVELASGNYFQTFGVNAAVGRTSGADDDREAAHVVVLSNRWWRTRFAADPGVVGRIVHLNGTPFTVVGVAPPSLRGSYDALPTDLWAPLMTYDVVRPRGLDIRRRGWGWLQATGRLAPGASVQAAGAEAAAIAAALKAEYPREDASLRFTVVPASTLPESMTPELGRGLLFAIGIAVLALLAACANVANAALATVSDRGAEIAVRMALGASRVDIARQWLAESLVATALATGLGLVLAVWLRDALAAVQSLSGYDNFAPSIAIGWQVWVSAAVLMATATALSGVLPAYRACRVAPAQPLRDGATATTGSSGHWLRSALVSAQAAVALSLLALAALLGQSLVSARWSDVGFDRRGLVIATANVSALGHDAVESYAYHTDAMARIRALPGADEVTAASVVPLGNNDEREGITIDGYTPSGDDGVISMANNIVWPGYFEVMRIPIVAGRSFADTDGRPDAPLVAVVNETMARRYWPDGQAIGRIIRLDSRPVAVVGIARDITYYAIGEAPLPYLYLAYGPGQPYRDGLTFHVRSSLDPAVMTRQMTRELRARDPRVRVVNAMAYDDLRAAALLPARAMGWLSTGFSVLALALFVVGVYGVTAFAVAARRRELALRVALGAAPDAVRSAVVRRAVVWGLPGAAAGLLLTIGLAQLLQGVLVGVTALDPLSLAGATASVLGLSAVAAYVPARRVGRVDLAAELRR